MKYALRFFSLCLILTASFICFASSTHAATLNVVAGTDGIEENSQCQLSEAIQNINDQAQTNLDCPAGDGSDDTINLPAGTITLSGDLPELSKSVVFQGQGKSVSIIDGNNKQYTGIKLGLDSVPPFIDSFELHDTSILNTKNYGIFGYGIISFTLNNVSISDGDSGVIVVAQNVQVADTQIDNNVGTDNNLGDVGVTAGMYVQLAYTGEGSMPSFSAENSSISDNVTTTSDDMSFAGLAIQVSCYVSSGCDGDFTAVDVNSTQVDNNISYVSDEASFAGITLMAAFEQSYLNSPPTQLRINSTSISENSAESPTGAALSGLSLYPFAVTENSWLRNLTIHANTALTESNQVPSIAGAFGQLLASSLLEVSNITFTENQSQFPEDSYFPIAGLVFGRLDPDTGGVGSGIEMSNSVLSANTKNGDVYNCETSIDIGSGPSTVFPVSLGGNISDDASCNSSFTHPTDQTEVSNLASTLGPLSDNGGSVPTIPLLPGSPAIDAGVTVPGLTTDARGISRPQCAAFDSGAYEYNGTCPETSGGSDPDPIPDVVEDAAPNNGDGNGDGTPDSEQANVTSLPIPSGTNQNTYVTLVTPDGTTLTTTAIQQATDLAASDSVYDYPLGLVSFTVDGVTPGTTIPVTLYFHTTQSPDSFTPRKYLPSTQTFFDIPGATLTTEQIGSNPTLKLTYNLTDGGDLDDDQAANGTIVDPVGLATTKSATLASTGDNLWLYLAGIFALITGGVWLTTRQLGYTRNHKQKQH